MRKTILLFVQCALFISAIQPLRAQVSNPSFWESFVNSDENTLVSDTFRLQTFGDSEWDNWEYTTTGTTKIDDLSPDNIDKMGGKMGLRMSLGSEIYFQPYNLDSYTNVRIEFYFGGRTLYPGDKLTCRIYRKTEETTHILSSVTKDNTNCKFDSVIVKNTPLRFDLYTATTSSHKSSYYGLQYAFAYGDVPSYSLFSGIGNWNDTTLWSHLPPLRYRNALIKGDVAITTDVHCKNIALHSGTLSINPNNRFVLQNIDLYENDVALHSEGAIQLSGRITLHKTFEETGKWYFISFPFDVYPSGIGSGFEQKDDSPNDGGNYFYVQSYNGDKRASSNQSTENWEVVPVRPQNVPLFEKNKGYLIALDEKATNRTLSFSSRPGDIPEDFAHTGFITISLASDMAFDNQENYGWYLCGNPFPAPLPLHQIEKNQALDGNIYVYDGNNYKAYSLNSDYALPPFAAFFVKASSATELKVLSNSTTTKATNIIQTNFPLNPYHTEPSLNKQNTGIIKEEVNNIRYFIRNRQLYLQNIPESGYIIIENMQGKYILQRKAKEGEMIIPLIDQPGIYILQINTKNFVKTYKFRLQ